MEQRVRGLLAYLFGWIGGIIILLVFKDNTKETDYNVCQAIVLSAANTIINIILIIISAIVAGIAIALNINLSFIINGLAYLGYAIAIGYIVLVILGMINSYKEQEYKIPVISKITEMIFKSRLG